MEGQDPLIRNLSWIFGIRYIPYSQRFYDCHDTDAPLMHRILALLTIFAIPVQAEQTDRFDYFAANRTTIAHGMQAVLTCNGLFTSERTLDRVFNQELAYLRNPVGNAAGGDYVIDWRLKGVAIGDPESGPVIRAAFREGIGCVVMAPDQTFDDIDSLPILETPLADSDPNSVDWPNGDKITQKLWPESVNAAALEAASNWAFDRESPEQDTLSLIVLHHGEIIHERYADGIDRHTRTRTWSTAKSIAVTLMGMLVDDGRMELDAPLGFEWLPEMTAPENDPRAAITLRHVLNMSSGLYPVDSFAQALCDFNQLSSFDAETPTVYSYSDSSQPSHLATWLHLPRI